MNIKTKEVFDEFEKKLNDGVLSTLEDNRDFLRKCYLEFFEKIYNDDDEGNINENFRKLALELNKDKEKESTEFIADFIGGSIKLSLKSE